MKLLVISDKDKKNSIIENFENELYELFLSKKIDLKKIEIGSTDLKYCIGCFNCWVKTPGECIQKDMLNEINRNYVNSDIVVYISPIVFGQLSSNIKYAVDRKIPNILPFFEKKNGRTFHPNRYPKNPSNIYIGYGNDITNDEKNTFRKIIDHVTLTESTIFFTESNENNTEIINYFSNLI